MVLGQRDTGGGYGERQRASAGGFTMVEFVVTSALLAVAGYFLTSLMVSGAAAQRYAERNARVTEITQELVDEIRREVTTSVRVFHSDAIGTGYLGILDFSGTRAPIAHKLPTLSSTGIFEQETVGVPRTGNALLFARHAWSASYTAPSGNSYQIDVHRMVHYYLSEDGGGPAQGEPDGLDLVKWVSEPLADGESLDRIEVAADKEDIVAQIVQGAPDDDGLVHPPVEVTWLRGEDPATTGTLRHMLSSGVIYTTPQPPRSPVWQLKRDASWSNDGMLGYRRCSVVTNYAPASWGVSRFSVQSQGGSGFPHGVELQLIGPSSARQVLCRILLTSNNSGRKAHAAVQAVLDARDI